MPSMKRSAQANGRAKDEVRELKRENQQLRKKLKDAEDRYRRVMHAWPKQQVTEKDLRHLERQIKKGVKGGSLIELIRELEAEMP